MQNEKHLVLTTRSCVWQNQYANGQGNLGWEQGWGCGQGKLTHGLWLIVGLRL